MDADAQIRFLTARVQSLSQEKEAAVSALNAAAGLGHFDTAYSRLDSPEPILREIADRVRELLPLRQVALYLVDETTGDMVLAHAAGAVAGFDPEREIDGLIQDHSFSFALEQPGPTFFRAVSAPGRLLLHRLATPSRVRGMFMGLLDEPVTGATDTALALLSVVCNAGAAALESYFLYGHLASVNRGLERKVAERTAALRRSNEELRVILDSLPAGVVVIDPATCRVLDINPAGTAMMGLPREAVVGRPCFDSICSTARGDCPIMDGGQKRISVERALPNAAGGSIPILKNGARVSLGGRDCIIESFVDISEQRKLAALREDVERMTRHDLKAPLTGIIGIPDVMLADPEITEDQREMLSMVKESGLKMLGMINLSLDLYKMETGTYVLAPQPVDLAGVLSRVAEDLGALARAKNVALRFECEGRSGLNAPVMALGEELLYYSLFANLLKNAIEASPADGEVAFSVAARDRLCVSLHNWGVVPADIRPRFFEKYATSGKEGGTGLGAYSARLIVKNLGGNITFLSDEAAGTTIFLVLPRPAGCCVPEK
jgi:PAS domain S-box-containing protein